ncbi:unnamed protein product [Spirodela intermedia]|uniref:Acyl-coenzyme A oxidase n=1 Tax=Spirodela intermedia TaxID=51605 RepID=A0A7I8IIU4_SPIIN|nr:unnamed protein product [Spirodela intermedia]CAA6657076.1 unnamed protein product [Spirodela intermedia]
MVVASVDNLADERSKAQFDVGAMKIVWAGSKHVFDVTDRMARIVASDPVRVRKDNRTTLGRKELFKNTLRKMAHVVKRANELRLTEEEASKLRFFVDEPGYLDLHWVWNVCTGYKRSGTEEQQEKWLPLASRMEIIGCYAQTELGHGSNVQGLETTATFDPKLMNLSFIWWPGGLGKVSTHAVVYARLVSGGQEHGIYGFIVQLRSLDDHTPLGIIIGDIGTKFGSGAYNTMDNGFVCFNRVRIPRNHMLMRNERGNVCLSDVPKQMVYGTMVYVRQTIVSDASWALSRAVCIAVRYSAIRRQFGSQDGGIETQVLDYETQQSRLFPLLASAYAFRFVGEWLKWLYADVTERLQANDFSTLPEAHACTAGLKSLTTSVTADAIEECRKLCGGHGYLCSSGLPELFAVYVPACTYEGDNVVLLLQVSCQDCFSTGCWEKPVGTTTYMGNAEHLMQCKSSASSPEDWLKPSVVLEAFEARAFRLAVACARDISKFSTPEAGFAELSIDLVEAAIAHCEVIVVSSLVMWIFQVHREGSAGHSGDGVKEQLQILCFIYALHLIHKHSGEFLSTGCITPEQATLANEQLRTLYGQIKNVPMLTRGSGFMAGSSKCSLLVDAFNYTDHYLGSALGRYDGNVYATLYAQALRDPSMTRWYLMDTRSSFDQF